MMTERTLKKNREMALEQLRLQTSHMIDSLAPSVFICCRLNVSVKMEEEEDDTNRKQKSGFATINLKGESKLVTAAECGNLK